MNSFLFALVGFLITIGVIVLIHEGGHYLAAKWCGFAVKRFSIGFGPVIARFRAWDTEFALSVLPLGGYVMFDEGPENPTPAEKAHLMEHGPRWKRAIVIAAGPLMNFILAVILFAATGAMGVQDIVPYVAPKAGSQAEALGVEPLDRVTAVGGRRVSGVTDLNFALVAHQGEADVPIEFERAHLSYGLPGETSGAAAGKPEVYVRHFDLTDVTPEQIEANKGFAFPAAGLLLTGRGVMISDVNAGSAAERAGFAKGDLVVEAAGRPADMTAFAQAIREHPGRAVAFSVRRADGLHKIELVPDSRRDEKTGADIGFAGVRYQPSIEFTTVRYSPLESVELAVWKVSRLTKIQADAVAGMAEGTVSTDNLSGPVGIASAAGDAARGGAAALIEFIALISVAVGFMNLIPIPALDGGQLVVLGIEGAMRRDLPKSAKEKIAAVGAAILIAIFLFCTWNDLGRAFGG